MSLTEQTPRVDVTISTATDAIPFGYAFSANSELLVVSSGRGTLNETTDYTVSGAGVATGGTVTMVTGVATEKVTVLRNTPISQTLVLRVNGKFFVTDIGSSLDKITKILQEVDEELARCLKSSVSDGSALDLPDAAARMGKLLRFDDTGALTVTTELGDWEGEWETATAYNKFDMFRVAATASVYLVVTNHTSSNIASDFSSGKISYIIDGSTVATAAAAAATSETNAATAATAAATSATAAATSETNAASSETAAAASETAAAVSNTNAAATLEVALKSNFDNLNHLRTQLGLVKAGSKDNLRVLAFGDSLSNKIQEPFFETAVGPWLPDGAVISKTGGTSQYSHSGSTEFAYVKDGGTAADWNRSSNFDYGFNGAYGTLDSATETEVMVSFSYTDISTADRILIPYATETGAGAFTIQVSTNADARADAGHASWADPVQGDIVSSHTLTGGELIVDTDASTGTGVVELEYASATKRIIKLSHESGSTVVYLAPMYEVRTVAGVNKYLFATGGNNMGSSNATGAGRMSAIIAAYKPDVITVQSNDLASAYTTLSPLLDGAITDAALGYNPTVVLFGQGPQGSDNDTIIAANLAQIGLSNDYGWTFFDAMSVIESHADLVDLGWEGDGVHLSQDFYDVVADQFATENNLRLLDNLTVEQVATNNRHATPTSSAVIDYVVAELAGQGGDGIYFGLDGYGVAAGLTNSGIAATDFTVEFKGRVDDGAGGGFAVLFGATRGVQGFEIGGWSLAYSESTARVLFSNEHTSTSRTTVYGPPMAIGELAHIHMIVQPSIDTVTFYKNAAFFATGVTSSSMVVTSNDVPRLFSNTFDNYEGAGVCSKLRVFNRALSAADVLALTKGGAVAQSDRWGVLGGATGCVLSLNINEGVGEQLHDESTNQSDMYIRGTDTDFGWLTERKTGYLRAMSVDANGQDGEVPLTNRDMLPLNAIITRAVVTNNDATDIAIGAFDVERYNGTLDSVIGDNAVAIAAGESLVIYPDAAQDVSYRRVKIANNADSGMDDFNIRVDFEIID